MTTVSTPALHVALLAVSAAVTAILAGYSWRRPEQGTRPFVGLLCVFTIYTAAQLIGLLTIHPTWRLVWENVQWTGTALIPVFWMLFAMEYTGYDGLITRKTIAALSVVPLLTILFTWTNQYHGLMWTHNVLVPVDGLALVEETFGPWFWVYLAYTYGVLAVGSALLVRLIWISDYLYADQSVLLVVGVAVPVVANVLTLVGLTPIQHPALDMTPYAFTITGLAFGYALFRYRLFDLLPATRQLGRHGAISQLEDGVVIVDTGRQVIYLNRAMADQLDCEPSEALGRPVNSLVDESALQFGTEDSVIELDRDGRVYEIRTSPIHDRSDRLIGHTLISQDVSARKERERRLARQRAELETLNELNAVIRGVNSALLSATTRSEIEEAVCERLAASPLYRVACAADVPTWRGDADRWTVAGTESGPGPAELPALREEFLRPDDEPPGPVTITDGADDGQADWMVVPIVYGLTVYGELGMATRRDDVDDREREILAELGELVGHAINAAENRRLLSAEAVVELEFVSTDDGATLVEVTDRIPGRLELLGFVPGASNAPIAYLRVEGTSVERARDALAQATDGQVRTIRTGADGGHLEWTIASDSLLGAFAEQGANILTVTAEGGTGRYTVEVTSDTDVRVLLDRVRHAYPDTTLDAKRQHNRAIERVEGVPDRAIEDLTERQREALEAAYRAGYFEWPRGSTAEEVAARLDISAPTLHAHLRKAERRLFEDLFGE